MFGHEKTYKFFSERKKNLNSVFQKRDFNLLSGYGPQGIVIVYNLKIKSFLKGA